MADPTSYVSAANMKKNVLYEEWQPLGPPDRPTAQCVELYYISFVDEIQKIILYLFFLLMARMKMMWMMWLPL